MKKRRQEAHRRGGTSPGEQFQGQRSPAGSGRTSGWSRDLQSTRLSSRARKDCFLSWPRRTRSISPCYFQFRSLRPETKFSSNSLEENPLCQCRIHFRNPDEDTRPRLMSPNRSLRFHLCSKPFVLPSRTGGTGGKDKCTNMLLIAGAVVSYWLFSSALFRRRDRTEERSSANDAGKPNLGRVGYAECPGTTCTSRQDGGCTRDRQERHIGSQDIEKTKATIPAAPGLCLQLAV